MVKARRQLQMQEYHLEKTIMQVVYDALHDIASTTPNRGCRVFPPYSEAWRINPPGGLAVEADFERIRKKVRKTFSIPPPNYCIPIEVNVAKPDDRNDDFRYFSLVAVRIDEYGEVEALLMKHDERDETPGRLEVFTLDPRVREWRIHYDAASSINGLWMEATADVRRSWNSLDEDLSADR